MSDMAIPMSPIIPSPTISSRILETTLDLVLVCTQQGELTMVSPSCKDILGYEQEEMVGHVASDFLYPDDLEATRNEMRAARNGQLIRHFDCRYVHKDGSTIILTWSGVWDDVEQRHFFIGRDITQARTLETLTELEKQLKQLDAKIAHSFGWLYLLRLSEVRVLELALATCSIWAAYTLLIPPPLFTDLPVLAPLSKFRGSEPFWGIMAGIAAFLKLAGIALVPIKRYDHLNAISLGLRIFGLAFSSAFWIIMGALSLWAVQRTVFGFPGLVMGVLALWSILRILERSG